MASLDLFHQRIFPRWEKTNLARQLEVQCKQGHQRPMLSRKQAQEVLPVSNHKCWDVLSWSLLGRFNTLCMCWNWFDPENPCIFFSHWKKREADVKFLGLLVSPPSLSSKNRQRDMRPLKVKKSGHRYQQLSEHFSGKTTNSFTVDGRLKNPAPVKGWSLILSFYSRCSSPKLQQRGVKLYWDGSYVELRNSFSLI